MLDAYPLALTPNALRPSVAISPLLLMAKEVLGRKARVNIPMELTPRVAMSPLLVTETWLLDPPDTTMPTLAKPAVAIGPLLTTEISLPTPAA